MLMQTYEDCNVAFYLQHNPLYANILEGDLASQATLSRFENSINKQTIFSLSYEWVDPYVSSLKGRRSITLTIDATDD